MLCSFNLINSFTSYGFYAAAGTVALGSQEFSTAALIGGGLLALLVAFCVFGGGRRIVRVTSVLVPIMGVLYILMALLVMALNIGALPGVMARIFSEAFDAKAIFGGFAGSAVMQGVKRGLYSNEAGIGSAPNAAAAAEVSHPVKQGLVQMLSVFIDTLLICSATAMMTLCTGVDIKGGLEGAPLVQASLATVFGQFGPYFVTFALLLFAFTTLLGNLFYCEGCMNYIVGRKVGRTGRILFNVIAVALVFAGALLEVNLVWNIADVLMGVMALINLPVIVILGGTAIRALEDYLSQRSDGRDPVFKASSIGLRGRTDFWN